MPVRVSLRVFKQLLLSLTTFVLFSGKDDVHLIGENLTPRKYAEILSKALGIQVTAKDLSKKDFESQAQSDNVFAKELYLNMKCVATISTQAYLCSDSLSFSGTSRTIASPSQHSMMRLVASRRILRGPTLRSS